MYLSDVSCTESEVDHPATRRHKFDENVVVYTIPVNYDPEWGYCSGLNDSVDVTRIVPLLAPGPVDVSMQGTEWPGSQKV